MTRIIVLDFSTGNPFIITVDDLEWNDLEEAVAERLDTLGTRIKDCQWMTLPADFNGTVPAI